MAGRSKSEILESFKSSAKLSDPTVDVEKGPLYDLIARPLATVLEPTEALVDRLEKIYSSEYALTADEEDAAAFLTNWGEEAGAGTPATVRVYFLTFTKPEPGEIVDIPIGSLIGNSDQTLQFVTREGGQIRGDSANSYYNPSRRAWEVGLLCEAVAVGTQYELPSGRIVSRISALPGIDAVENRERCTPGTAAETIRERIERVQEKFKGLAVNTANGAYTRIKRYAPTAIQDVKTILPNDRRLFKRIVYGPAKDYYVLGTLARTKIESYRATGGESEFTLTNVPALAINSLTINNVPFTNYALKKDISRELGGSAKAEDKIILGVPLLANDVVSVSITYNHLIQGIQQDVLNEEQLFFTDELAREFRKVPLRIEISGRALPSYDPVNVENEVKAKLEELVGVTTWTEAFYPNQILQEIRRTVLGLTNIQLVRFQRSTGATSDLEIAIMEQNEIAVYDSNYISVQIRTV